MSVRVRYAPSPTGYQHIGGVRTALFNYLFAKSHSGSFIVRIEDTDRIRSEDVYRDDVFGTLEWLGVDIDEHTAKGEYAPYVQSERSDIYKKYADELVKKGRAYYCFTSEKYNHNSLETNVSSYDRSSRDLSVEQQERYRKKGISPVIRVKMPLEGMATFTDMVLGEVSRNYKDLIPDPILLKSDGMPTYHLANVVDDHLMKITHVMRSQEWIPTTPVHCYLYEAFEWEKPQFCHLPMVLGEDGQKLSKRNGSMSIQDIRLMGVLPKALINCIALLGWSYDGAMEFFTMEELETLFSRGNINKAPAQFSMQKLRWFNAHYIRESDNDVLAKSLLPFFINKGYLKDTEYDLLLSLIPLIKERLELLSDAPNLLSALFSEPILPSKEMLCEESDIETVKSGLSCARFCFSKYWELSEKELQDAIHSESKQRGLRLKHILMPLRMALTGSKTSPPILALAKRLSLDTVLTRIEKVEKLLV